jgi:hypothetical protein
LKLAIAKFDLEVALLSGDGRGCAECMVAALAVFWITTLFRIDGMIEWAADSAM